MGPQAGALRCGVLCGPRAAEAAHRPGEPEVADGGRGLGAVAGLEIRHEVEPPAVIGAVVRAAERDDAQRVVAAPEAARHEVRRVDRRAGAADAARLAL